MITVNNFFGHWFTDIDIRRYPDDTRILPAELIFIVLIFINIQTLN